jgi:hypothetical protein
MPSPFVTVYLFSGFLGLAYLVALHFLYERLMWHHAAKWDDLGRPAFFSGLGVLTTLRVLRFIATREYRDLHDPVLSRLSVSAIVLLAIALFAPLVLKAIYFFRDGAWPMPA